MSKAREMINAHLMPILALVATVSSVSIAFTPSDRGAFQALEHLLFRQHCLVSTKQA